MENIRSSIEIGNNLYDLTGPWVVYHNNLDTNMETLKRKTEQLDGRSNDINVEVNYAEQWSGKKRRVEVERWQEYVRRITADVQTLERQEQEVRGLKNAFKRAQLGKRVVDKIKEVEKLYENGEFSNGLLIDDPTRRHAIPTTASLAEPTSVRNREKIWNFLMDDAVRKIGVHGMGGVGKTTIMKSINNQLLSGTSTFSDVIWVTVSKALDIKNLQGQIAKKLKIYLSDNEDELRSASEINKMLSQKKRYVLILDDLWKEFPLEKMGIPEPTRDNGCKLVLTTRLVDVCTKMNCRLVEMELLTEEEALNLFMNNVKEQQTMLTTEVEEIAKEVAKKCARLPLAIVIMAGFMRVNDIREWRNVRNVQWLLDKLIGDPTCGHAIPTTESLAEPTSVDSASCSDTSNDDKDDDSFRMNMEPLYSISPNGSFKRNIKSWHKGECLGSGSFGTVYEAFTDDGFFFAVKEVSLLDQGSQGKESISQLEQEILLLSQFEHKNIVQYLGKDKVDSKLYIFLELVTKGSLLSLYQKYHLSDPQVSLYTRQILNGLNYLHSRNVVHRDIKCANILVDASGSVKLADFGLAKVTKLNDVKSCKGTPLWMAPEVVNQKDGYGLAADIWSLGCTVLEMLTRQIPYFPLEGTAAVFRIGKGELPPIPNSLSSDAQDFIFRCLKVNPNYRPTAAELLNHPFVKRPMAQGLKNFDQPLAIEDVRF